MDTAARWHCFSPGCESPPTSVEQRSGHHGGGEARGMDHHPSRYNCSPWDTRFSPLEISIELDFFFRLNICAFIIYIYRYKKISHLPFSMWKRVKCIAVWSRFFFSFCREPKIGLLRGPKNIHGGGDVEEKNKKNNRMECLSYLENSSSWHGWEVNIPSWNSSSWHGWEVN